MPLSDKDIQDMKDLLEEKECREFTWDEAADAARNLAGFAKLLFDCWQDDQRREAKLVEHPKGFALDGAGYTCAVCGNGTAVGENWYDKWGIKCATCQRAIDRKEIPASLAKRRDSWYSRFDLESSFNLKGPTISAWVRKGILRARTVTGDGGGVHAELFLLKDNKGFLPPKKLVGHRLVSEERAGKTWHRSEPWYCFVDPREHLKGFGIISYLRVSEG